MSQKNEKRFVSIAKYCELTGLNYKTVRHAIDSGQVKSIKTESGIYKIDTEPDYTAADIPLIKKLEKQERLLESLCKHLGVTA